MSKRSLTLVLNEAEVGSLLANLSAAKVVDTGVSIGDDQLSVRLDPKEVIIFSEIMQALSILRNQDLATVGKDAATFRNELSKNLSDWFGVHNEH